MGIDIRSINAGNFGMNYFKFGSGEKTMVILPGLSIQSVCLFADSVAKDYSVFEKDFTVYLFDRRNELPENYSIQDMADDTALCFKKSGLSDICLFGASQGGMIAQIIAAKYPELVNKLALCSTSVRVDNSQIKTISEWITQANAGNGSALYLSFGKAVYPENIFEQSKELLEIAGKAVSQEEFKRFVLLAQSTEGFDVTGEISNIRCPVFAAGSDDDIVLGSDSMSELIEKYKENKNFSYHIYENFGHACYDTAPDFKERLYSFFNA